MPTLSGCTLVRNVLQLNYPLEASILSYLPICDEVILAYDPHSDDETGKFVGELARRHPKIRLLPSPWNLENHKEGSEIAIQSNAAIEACTGEWVLYVQADEAIHEGDHEAMRRFLESSDVCAALFDRKSFLYSLDREIPTYRAQGLLRLFRNGMGYAVGDAMSCALVQGAVGKVFNAGWRLFNYGRMGEREEILRRARSLHGFYHASKDTVEQNLKQELTQNTSDFDPNAHPLPIRKFYGLPAPPRPAASPVTLAVLLGPGERDNIVPFLWPFRGWYGDIVVVDDTDGDGSVELFSGVAAGLLGVGTDRMRIVRNPAHDDFAAARNQAQDAAGASWVLHADLDERWEEDLLKNLPRLVAQLDRDGKTVCGFPRLNVVGGVLVNDVPDAEWTEEGLRRRVPRTTWPPQNRDVQFRLLKKTERWTRPLHELPEALLRTAERAVELRDHWILHAKTLDRQRCQDRLYRSRGQERGMPQEEVVVIPDQVNLRETVLAEAIRRLPPGDITVVETGTLRDPSPQARLGDGWSTYHIARLLADRGSPGSRLFSIEIDPQNVEISRRTVPPELHPWVTWICDDSRRALKVLEAERIDLLYLDSSDDPALIQQEFETALPKLAPHGLAVIDDTGDYRAGPQGKGSLLIPELQRRGWRIEHRRQGKSRMTIASCSQPV
jgi:predicted O-methyltransferase YrrM/glycosyltransferase involved in cell wall biosynthesis